jgi:putative endonuclease
VPVRSYYVYIMSNAARTLYIGVTNDLERRVHQHKQRLVPGFTATYRVTYLVHYEETSGVYQAIEREKQLKGWTRAKKVALIESSNPEWRDLSLGWQAGDGAGQSVGPSLRSG